LAKVGKTTFTWLTVDQSDGPREDYAPGAKRSVVPVTVADGTEKGRRQAAADFIGSAALRTLKLGSNLVTYLTRVTPMPYPGSENLYAYSLVSGNGLGSASLGADGGVAFSSGYQFQAVFTSRTYLVKEDGQVKAKASAGIQSPLFDSASGNAFPDEGDALKRGWENSRYVTKRVVSSARLITVRDGFCAFADGTPLPEQLPFNEGMAQCRYVWHAVPVAALPNAAIRRCLGALNTDAFDFALPNTLMLTSWDYDAQPGPLGDILCDIAYNFLYIPKVNRAGTALGHSAALRKTGAAGAGVVDYDRVTVFGNPNRWPFKGGTQDATDPASLIDFADLFRPAQPTG
jgi:hypothetical protein